MGSRINLVRMGLAPATLNCPKCAKVVDPRFWEYDIECVFPTRKPGELSLGCYCPGCEHEWTWRAKVVVTELDRHTDLLEPWVHDEEPLDPARFEEWGHQLENPMAASEGHRYTLRCFRRLWDEAKRLSDLVATCQEEIQILRGR